MVSIFIGLAGLIACLAFQGPWYLLVLGIGLIVWGTTEIIGEIRDRNSRGEVAQLKSDREEIRRRISKEN